MVKNFVSWLETRINTTGMLYSEIDQSKLELYISEKVNMEEIKQ